MAANYALPGSLEPPSYGEMARIGALSGEVEHRALAQLRREIGLRNMQSETAAAIAQGQEPLVARRNALLNNARFLFADNPQALVALQHNEESAQMRDAYQRAMLQQRMLHEQNYALAVKSADEARDEANRIRDEANRMRAEQTKEHALPADIQIAQKQADLQAQLRASLARSTEDAARVDLETGKIPGPDPAELEKQARLRDELSALGWKQQAAEKRESRLGDEGTAAEPVVKVMDDGSKLVWMPGSKTVHVVGARDTWAQFYAREAAAFQRLMIPGKPADHEKALREIWDKAHPEAKSPSPKPAVSDATAKATLKFVPGTTYQDAKGNKAVYQADGTWKPVP